MQVKCSNLQAGVGLAGPGEGGADSGAVEAAAVKRESQARLGGDLALRRQVAQKWHAQRQFFEGVYAGFADATTGFDGLVGECQAAAGDVQVVERELRQLALRRIRRGFEPRQYIVNVESPVWQPRQPCNWLFDGNGVGHRSQTQQ